ncbi:hypothetical protein OWR29_07020 [Actinoplanes sp. Pm04-4]|uniref:Uncharacterized protein n=1 Tax=Paractinoplanes pyxinae TaxID=2997416 RepID=A0ABT4AU84_9ACTN|nr:hypothetical protein [Actinoplanes pyxinae]MCY1137747.1 hypothetical protein [Actinoplanes pyxinae]
MDESGHSGDAGAADSGNGADSRERARVNGWATSDSPWSFTGSTVDTEAEVPAWRRPGAETRSFPRNPAFPSSAVPVSALPSSSIPAPAPAPAPPGFVDAQQSGEIPPSVDPGTGGSRWDRSRFSELLSPATPPAEPPRPAAPPALRPVDAATSPAATSPAAPSAPPQPPAALREPGLGAGNRLEPGLGTGDRREPGLGTGDRRDLGLGSGDRREPGLGTGSLREPGPGTGDRREPGLGTGDRRDLGLGAGSLREPGLGTGDRREPGLGSGDRREAGLGTGDRREAGLGAGDRREPGLGSGTMTPGLTSGNVPSARPAPLRAYDVPTPSSAPPYPYEGDLDDATPEPAPPIVQQRAAVPLVRPAAPGGRRADWGTAEHKTTEPPRHALSGGTPVQGVPRVASDEPGPARPAYDPSSFPRRLSYETPKPYDAPRPYEPKPYEPPAPYSGFGETTARLESAVEPRGLPQRVPAQPDLPRGVPEPPLVEATAETPALARIATHLRRGDVLPAQERQEGFDVQAILAAVREVEGVRDASLRQTPTGAHSLRLDLAEGADPAEVSRRVARLLQDRMGLDAAMPGEVPAPAPAAAPVSPSALVPRSRLAEPAAAPAPPVSAPPVRPPSLTDRRAEEAAAREQEAREAREKEARERAARELEARTREREKQDREKQERETREREEQERETRERETREAREREAREREARDRHAAAARLVPEVDESAEVVPTGEYGPPRPLYPGEHPGPRIVIENVHVNTFGSDATVEVRLTVGNRTASGVASGPAVDGYLLRLCAMATAGAVDDLLAESDHPDGPARCFVEHAAAVPFGATQVAVVVLLLSCGGWVEQLAGSAVVSSDDRHAMVRATLAAVNRRLEALLSR